MDNLRGTSVPVKPAHLLHDLNQKMSAREVEKLTSIQKPEINDLINLQGIPQDLDKLLEDRIRDESEKAPLSLQSVLPYRKGLILNKMIDAWLKENPEKGWGGWLWNLVNRKNSQKK